MYAIRIPGDVSPRTNAALRDYARLEYRKEDVHWLLASSRRAKRTIKPRRPLRLFTRKAAPAHRPVACKGTPRYEAGEAKASA